MSLLKKNRWLLLAALTTFLSSCYSMRQLYYQGNLLATRHPIKVLIWQKSTSDSLRQSLRYVTEVLAFAKSSGLATGGAYRTYIDAGQRPVSYIVNAAEPTKLKAKKWWFPIVGTVPYLGFYHRAKRNEQAEQLRDAGYDVNLGAAGAFSSLGWYDDPIYESMLRRPPAELAHLLFHELTHRTFWIPGEVKLNENLAEFVAGVLIEAFLQARNESQGLNRLRQKQRDQAKFRKWLKDLKKDLKTLYATKSKSDAAIKKAKQLLFENYLSQKFPSFETDYYEYAQKRKWNNATVLNYSNYEPNVKPFSQAYGCMASKNIGSFLQQLAKNIDSGSKPLKALDLICQKGNISPR